MFHLDDYFHYIIKTDSVILLNDDKNIKLNIGSLQYIRFLYDLICAKSKKTKIW